MPHTLLSIIIPVYNEQDNIEPLLKRLLPIIENQSYEVIFINDGSTDKTEPTILSFAKRNKNIKLVSFYRNFGHQMALACGYEKAKGDCIVSMDADLQDPPEVVREMMEQWKNGAKIVYAKRAKRDNDNLFKRTSARIFYSAINFLSDVPIPQDVGDFRLVDREVAQFINNLPEKSRFLRGLVAWGGFPTQYVYFDRDKRYSGQTHYPLSKMINFALDGITSFSLKPLRLATFLGFISSLLGFIGIVYAIVGRIISPYWVTGWTLLFVGIMFMGGVQLITIGIIGEYISKIYREIQHRPRYLIRDTVNV